MRLKAFVPMGGSVAGMLEMDGSKEAVTLMNDAAKALPSGKLEAGQRHDLDVMHRSRPEIVALSHIHDTLLAEIKPAKRWGELRPVHTKSGQVLWICEKDAAIQQPPIQKI